MKLTPRWSASFHAAQAIRGNAAVDRTVDRGEPLQGLGLTATRQRYGTSGQFLNDRPELFGVEDPRRLGKRPQCAFDAELFTGLLPLGGLLQGAEAFQRGIAEIHQ